MKIKIIRASNESYYPDLIGHVYELPADAPHTATHYAFLKQDGGKNKIPNWFMVAKRDCKIIESQPNNSK